MKGSLKNACIVLYWLTDNGKTSPKSPITVFYCWIFLCLVISQSYNYPLNISWCFSGNDIRHGVNLKLYMWSGFFFCFRRTFTLKNGHQCSSGEESQIQNFDIYYINEVRNISFFYMWINKPFSEENKVPRTLFEARQVAGSATYNQSETVWLSCPIRSVCLFSHENKES